MPVVSESNETVMSPLGSSLLYNQAFTTNQQATERLVTNTTFFPIFKLEITSTFMFLD